MSRRSYDSGLKEHSGWLVPSAILLAIVLLGAIFLVYYLAPNPASLIQEHASPTSRTDPVAVSVGGLALRIPSNYVVYPSERRGGARREIALFALIPAFKGYNDDDAATFGGNGANSPIVHIVIREEEFSLAEQARLARIYLPDAVDEHGTPGPFGLTRYTFREDSGYRGEDLFVGRGPRGPVVMHCARRSPDVPSPNCLREILLTNGVTLSYRFKRSHLAEWSAVAVGVAKLVQSFTNREK